MVLSSTKRLIFACGMSAAIGVFALCVSAHAGQDVTIEGRLSLLEHGQEQWLVLLAHDGQSYKITGKLRPRLTKTLDSLGEKNLVTLKGMRGDKSLVPCLVTRDLVRDDKGTKTLRTDVRCITYYTFEAAQIVAQGASGRDMPGPLRDREQEKILAGSVAAHQPAPAIVGEIYGKVIATTPRKPVKSIEVESRDTDGGRRALTILIGPETRIIKKLGGSEPVGQTAEQLKVGQEVTVVYRRRELRTEADYITITKE